MVTWKLDGQTYDLGNTIQNANTHNINSTLNMNKFYKYIGLTKKPVTTCSELQTPAGSASRSRIKIMTAQVKRKSQTVH